MLVMPDARVEFLFDYASPYSYLASEMFPRVLPGVAIDYRPVYLRGFEMFAKGVPHTASKMMYLVKDVQRCAADEDVPLAMPPSFPINGLYALRGALAAQRAGGFAAYHRALFHAAWRDGRDVSRKEIVVAIATELGLPEVAASLDDPALKERLRADTEAASRRGAFGVPTFFVGDQMFWGHDRLGQVARACGLAT